MSGWIDVVSSVFGKTVEAWKEAMRGVEVISPVIEYVGLGLRHGKSFVPASVLSVCSLGVEADTIRVRLLLFVPSAWRKVHSVLRSMQVVTMEEPSIACFESVRNAEKFCGVDLLQADLDPAVDYTEY